MGTMRRMTIGALVAMLFGIAFMAPASAAVNCTEMERYRQDVAGILLEHEDTFEALGEAMEDDDALFTMSPRRMDRLGEGLIDLGEDLEDYDPPASAEDYHESFTESMLLLGNMFVLGAESGIFTAAMLYADQIEETEREFEQASKAVERACPGWLD